MKKYDLDGKELGEVEFQDQLLEVSLNPQMIQRYIVALLANKRQWSANTKGRSEIAHSNAKPHAQKGTGKARQGTIKAPQYKGGGVVFGPKPKFNQKTRMNRKEKQFVIRSLLAQKLSSGAVFFLQLKGLEAPQTKRMAHLLGQMGLAEKKVLFLSDANPETKKERENIYLSLRNLSKVSFLPTGSLNGYDLMKNEALLISETSIEQIENILKRGE